MRVSEVIRLDRTDLCPTDGRLLIRESEFGKSRIVPLHPSVLEALQRYARLRDDIHPRSTTASFFVSIRGNRMVYPTVQAVFRNLCATGGNRGRCTIAPRIHDLRHTFAIRTLIGWYRAGEDVEARLPVLSTYLGHRDPRWTYWYLSAAPELLGLWLTPGSHHTKAGIR